MNFDDELSIEELFKAMRDVADYFNWDLSKREDPDRDDVVSGNVWGDLEKSAIAAALAVSPKPFRVPKHAKPEVN